MAGRCRQMHDGIIDITKLENVPHGFDLYRLETNRFKNICGHIYIYKVVFDNGKTYLTDDSLTIGGLGVNWGMLGKEEMERVDNILAKYSASRTEPLDAINSAFFWGEDEVNEEIPNFLDAIEAVYKEFLG